MQFCNFIGHMLDIPVDSCESTLRNAGIYEGQVPICLGVIFDLCLPTNYITLTAVN